MKKFIIFLLIFFGGIYNCDKSIAFFGPSKNISFDDTKKTVEINDNGLAYSIDTKADTISDLLDEEKIKIGNNDQIIPGKDSKLLPGSNILIRRAAKISIDVDGKTIQKYTLENNIANALSDAGITLSRLDKTVPSKNMPVQNGVEIIVTRINEEEITVNEDIDFKTISKSDPKMGWREKKIETPGEKGTMEV
jgi:uncharacterized protein YabE (DUF348 family)